MIRTFDEIFKAVENLRRKKTISVAMADDFSVLSAIKEVDERGRINLSIKAVDPDFASRKGLNPTPAGVNTNHKPPLNQGSSHPETTPPTSDSH